MRQILRLAINDVRLTLRDRAAVIWMLLMPIVFMWVFGQMGGGGRSGPPKVTLSIVDHDGGWLAEALVEDLRAESFELRRIAPADLAAAKDRVRTLAIPGGFTERVLAGDPQELRLELDPGANEQATIAARAHVIRAIGRTLARLAEISAGGEDPAAMAGEPAQERLRSMAARAPLVSLAVSTAGRGRPVPGGLAQSVPGILTMTVLMCTLIYGAVFLTIEKRDGVLRRQAGLPLTKGRIYLGKLAGRLAVAGAQIILLLLVGRVLFGVRWGRSPAGLAILLVCYALAVAGLSTLLGALLSTPEQASAVGWVLSMFMAGVGGCWWPSELMPRWLWTAAHAVPTAWAMDALHALVSFGRGVDAVLIPSAVLLAFAGVFALLGARFLRYA